MPIYLYEDKCFLDPISRNVPIDERDNQFCKHCDEKMKRKLVFTGLTWAPTAGGMR